MSRIRVAYTAGAAIGPDLFRFYRSIGINLKQLYGQTETCAYVCLQPDGQIKLDSVGKPAPGVEVKLADNGEVLVKGPMLLKAYYKRPDATAESINADGYFMTGDAGFFDEDGHLKIIDRAKDVGKLTDGGDVRAQLHREQAQVLPAHQGGGASATAGLRHRLRQHRPRSRRQLGRAQGHGLFRLHRSRRQPEVYTS
jgi:long-subunit acyl-CoA synthetase (AMP-forming)